jgi:ethanolamine utilization protein EutA
MRLAPLSWCGPIDQVSFSGGVAEYVYGGDAKSYGDLGLALAAEIRARAEARGLALARPEARIRATVIGASQYTMQVSGSTIFVKPLDALPLRNVPVIAPDLALDRETIDAAAIERGIKAALKRLDLADGARPVALFVRWRGSATFARLDAFCRGVAAGLVEVLSHRHPLVLVGEGDVGGLIGVHLHEELRVANAIVSIDGLELGEFDYVDIGTLLESSGAVPVVIKSLIFPGNAVGRDASGGRTQAGSEGSVALA